MEQATGPVRGTQSGLLLIGLVGGVAFSALLAAAAWVYDAVTDADGISGLDRPVLDWMASHRTPASGYWVTAFTDLGQTLPMTVASLALVTVLYLRFRRRTAWVLLLVAAAGSITFTAVGKAVIARARPPIELAVPPYEINFSFPSGHTLNATVIAGMLAYLVVWLAPRRWERVLAVLLAVGWSLAMGLSRVFLGHHWITDVVFAWAFGLAWLALLITAHRVLLHFRTPISLTPET